MSKAKKRKGKIKVTQRINLVSYKNNAGNIGHPPALNNSANIRITIKQKT